MTIETVRQILKLVLIIGLVFESGADFAETQGWVPDKRNNVEINLCMLVNILTDIAVYLFF